MDIRDSLLFLLVFLSLINLSKEACDDYFTFNYWKNNFTIGMINLATTNNSKDVVECTLDTYCKNKPDTCFLLLDCFKDMNQTEKCSPQLGKSENVTIHTYHFMCMVYKKANVSLSAEVSEFCSITNYETVCQFVAETTKSDRTSPTTTTPQTTTTTPPPPTTTTTTTTTTTLPQTTIALQPTRTPQPPTTTTLPPQPTTTSPPPPPPTTTTTPGSIEKQAQNSVAVDKACPDNLILRLLPISIGFAMALLLLVYIYMRKQRRLNIRRATHVSNETMPGAETIIELQADTPHANGIVERTRLMQPEEYPSAVAPSADADAEADVECSVESGTQL